MRHVLTALLVIGLAACGSGAEAPEPGAPGAQEPRLEETEDGNFTLYVSNQSFDRRNVDIKIWINGFVAVEDDFDVGDQHNWVEFRFRLADGPHTIRVDSESGEATLEEQFDVRGKRWAVVDYWCCDGPAEPKFSLDLANQPIAFA